jgi:ornithine cyclodeaminase/alanine dehydrogenase-like protein (mu-crystallin family)
MSLRILSAEDVRRHLTYEVCIPLVREAMIALSSGTTQQLLRQIMTRRGGHGLYGVMAGEMGEARAFGSKLLSVSHEASAAGLRSHEGVIVLFDGERGTPACVLPAADVTVIRTAAASAVATDALARADSSRLAILGTGEQAVAHVFAISRVRAIRSVAIWGRTLAKAEALAARLSKETGSTVTASSSVQRAVSEAEIICTTTSASEPILLGDWVAPGTHINCVGSSRAGPAEIDNALVVRSRFFADQRESVLKQGAEFIRAREAGLIDNSHLLAEIGEVLAGASPGRRTPSDITLYKSLGNIVQDLASATYLHTLAEQQNFGTSAPF